MLKPAALFLAATLAATPLPRPADDEARVVNAIVDRYAAEARAFWQQAAERDSNTMRGRASTLHVTRLAVARTTIAPRTVAELREDSPASAKQFETLRRRGTPLYHAYAALAHGRPLPGLARRTDLELVDGASAAGGAEQFYARHPGAQGLLRLSAPAIAGDEALVYAQLLLVYGEEGVVHHLRKVKGRWQIDWQATLYDAPGC